MGLLDSLAGQVLGSLSGGANAADGTQQVGGSDLMAAIMGLINQHGGLPGLIGALEQGGLGNIAASWVGIGANQPVSGDQLQSALGGSLGQFAQALGISPQDALSQLASMLPQVVDKLTPNGGLSELGSLLGALKL